MNLFRYGNRCRNFFRRPNREADRHQQLFFHFYDQTACPEGTNLPLRMAISDDSPVPYLRKIQSYLKENQ
jgi:hypothetical protein